jgi:pimeloyl-ACP methyl ester carboxylesterase
VATRNGARSRRGWRHRLLQLTVGVLALALIGVAGLAAWLEIGLRADPAALELVASDDRLALGETEDGALVLSPGNGGNGTAAVFYPGARVSPDAYLATWAPIVLETGVTVFVPSMPLNLAVLDADRAETIRAQHPEFDTWILGGHSMGGFAVVDHLASGEASAVDGVVLWASGVSPREAALDLDVPVLTVAGDLDTVIPLDAIERGQQLLGDTAELVVVEGMSHSQFGRYRPDALREGRSDDETQRELTAAVADFVDRLD